MKLYIGCSLTTAPEAFKHDIARLKDALRGDFEVMEFVGLTAGTAKDVYLWDIEHCVAGCDLLVAVCDHPSLGLGWEMAEALRLGKPVLAVAARDAVVSRLVLGAAETNSAMTFRRYDDLVRDISAYARVLTASKNVDSSD